MTIDRIQTRRDLSEEVEGGEIEGEIEGSEGEEIEGEGVRSGPPPKG